MDSENLYIKGRGILKSKKEEDNNPTVANKSKCMINFVANVVIYIFNTEMPRCMIVTSVMPLQSIHNKTGYIENFKTKH